MPEAGEIPECNAAEECSVAGKTSEFRILYL
jgi:hypothetical protein